MKKTNCITVLRPWGLYTLFAENQHIGAVKILHINQGEGLSYQSHRKRSQLYVILDEGFELWDSEITTLDVKKDVVSRKPNIIFPKINQIFTHAINEKHRLIYNGKMPFGRVLDIAFGENDENDITRYNDFYNRKELK